MVYKRVILHSNVLSDIINIPQSLKNKKVELIILPLDGDIEEPDVKTKELSYKKKSIAKLKGALSKYKKPELIEAESGAWSEAVLEKHENS